jgi:hypothetical protein
MSHRCLGLCVVALAGCAASYQPYSVWNDGGYTEHEVQPNRFQVRFVGNEHSTEIETEELATLRAAELCLGRNKPFMLLQDFATDAVVTGSVPAREVKIAGPDTGPAAGRAEGETRYATVSGKTLYTPKTDLTATCISEPAEGALDAAQVAQATRAKYGISRRDAH